MVGEKHWTIVQHAALLGQGCLAILYPKRFTANLFRMNWHKTRTFRPKYLRTNENRLKFYVAGILSTPWDLEHPAQSTLVPCTSYCFSHCNCFGAASDTTCQKLAKFDLPLGSGAPPGISRRCWDLEHPLGSRGGAGIWSTPWDLVDPLGSGGDFDFFA